MSVDALCKERVELIVKKHTTKLSQAEKYRLQSIDNMLEVLKPRVTQADWEKLREAEESLG